MTQADETSLRQAIIDGCLWMNEKGLNQGTSGNISIRFGDNMIITPSGIPYDQLTPDMLCRVPLRSGPDQADPNQPSTEWRFHQALLNAKTDQTAVVHAHPAHATAVAVQGREIPACHYMVAAFGGNTVPLVDYALFGSPELARMVASAMAERSGCLMANHGAITTGESLPRALWRMQELENLARVYLLAQSCGVPQILSDQQIDEVLLAFGNYGPKR